MILLMFASHQVLFLGIWPNIDLKRVIDVFYRKFRDDWWKNTYHTTWPRFLAQGQGQALDTKVKAKKFGLKAKVKAKP